MAPSKLIVALSVAASFCVPANADVYMQNPRGSNNRNCRNDNNTNRRNGNRLFDSQNNDKGGYSCPRAYPFACYDNLCGGNNNNGNNQRAQANAAGGITARNGQAAVNLMNTEQQYYYEGSIVPLEWTNQHGCGTNTKVRCQMVIQYGCEAPLAAAPATPAALQKFSQMAVMRDGAPITNNSGNNRDDEATDTIPNNNNNNVQTDMRYGRHEVLAYYQNCAQTTRNKGLFTADQNIKGDTARFSRQNPNGNRNGLECPEESEYYPYWGASPWVDLAILVDDPADCGWMQAESQNVKARGVCTQKLDGQNDYGITPETCAAGAWLTVPANGAEKPSCAPGPWTRDNHLGNAGAGNIPGQQATFNYTIPAGMVTGQNCVMRLRYNMTTSDDATSTGGTTPVGLVNPPLMAGGKVAKFYPGEFAVSGDKTDNNLIYDRNNNEVKSYKAVLGFEVGTAVNTNQFARTFQDRSYTFKVKAAPVTGACAGKAILNLNVRGKRGNIVQTYPSVEYDFVPSVLEMETDDCAHVQFVGSDYNPNRNPNNGEGGPSNPNNNNESKADRSNMIPMAKERDTFPVLANDAKQLARGTAMFASDTSAFKKLAFLDQGLAVAGKANGQGDGAGCLDINALKDAIGGNNANQREKRERNHANCAKLSGQKTPVFDGGLQAAGAVGTHAYISTRNNNLSNRGHKGLLKVMAKGALDTAPGKVAKNADNNFGGAGSQGTTPGTTPAPGSAPAAPGAPATQKSQANSVVGGPNLTLALAIGGGLVAVAGAFVAYRKMNNNDGDAAAGGMMPMAAGAGGAVTAKYAHNAKEAGELSFAKGEKITVLKQDASGWWEGQNEGGARGVFPSNYVQ